LFEYDEALTFSVSSVQIDFLPFSSSFFIYFCKFSQTYKVLELIIPTQYLIADNFPVTHCAGHPADIEITKP
jgi:hypothetical protein